MHAVSRLPEALLAVCFLGAIGVGPALADPTEPAKRVFTLDIVKRQIVDGMDALRVTQGERVEIRWTSDEDMVVHVHGYDAEVHVTPDTAAAMAFVAYAAGRFPIEAHAHQGPEHHREVTLTYLEVHPN